jgi:ferredoxin
MKRTRVVLSFPPDKVEEPVTYRLIKDYDLMVNILRAMIDPHRQGRMVVELSGDEEKLSLGLAYLEKVGVGVEPLTEEIHYLEERCTNCTACIAICPTGALHVDRQTWVIDYDPEKCVVCLSCVESCPYRAIEAGTG